MSPPKAVNLIARKFMGAEIFLVAVIWPEVKCINIHRMHMDR